MLEGIGIGVVVALGWVAVLLLVASPQAKDRASDGVLGTVMSVAATAAGLIAFDRGGDLADVHGRWVGYGSVFGALAFAFAAAAVILRRFAFFRAWQVYGIRIGPAPVPKSRRAQRSQRV